MRRVAVRYGTHRSQIAELWRPEGPGTSAPVPVVVLVHGGYWRAVHTKHLMHRLARAVTDEGWAAWNIEYRRVGRLGGGGGWPATFEDVAAAVDGLARLPGLDLERVVACGHSAGGHLALWLAARGRLPEGSPGADPRVGLRAAVSLAGVVDLRAAARLGLGDDAAQKLLGGGPESLAEVYDLASPAELLPLGVPQVLVHGSADSVVPESMSTGYAEAARAAGDVDVVCEVVPGVDHMAVISPRSPAWTVTCAHLHRLLDP